MIPIIAKLVSSIKGGDIIKTVLDGADKLFTSKEEKAELALKLEEAMNAHVLEMSKLSQQELDSYLKDTQSARDSNVKIQESDKASWLAKNVGYCIDIFLILTFAMMLVIIIYKPVSTDNKELFYTSFGMLGMYVGQCISFHRGTTKGSADKQKTLDKMVSK